ncbi:DNA topoisomerase IB [Couchioplanes caeruleus]|uniref:DNA topoisomerase n=2 Tax=Couchioplanes caeruleus TaxID=56438 RepID=A0A1K0FBC1_9ACTN|nr:DNA topoisomerase IB [Couchioplanes caeruleus]OJF10048.1 DNA topoisomerase [Couchioplanes caeruleus subsp. caeruleus]ROP27669.1 DNA topoisomerase IB [Couchioplanes caeruleus]
MRLRRSDLTRPGFSRRRCGKGFRYLDADGEPLKDEAALARIKDLVIPPAWTDVWISTDPRGHVQATGLDAAGRKQYVYHPRWRTARDEKKFDHARAVAERLPEIRSRLCTDLSGRGLSRARVLAAITRLLDMGMFRVGSDQYAQREEDPSFGLSTLRPEHVRTRGAYVVLEFTGKSGREHAHPVRDGEVCQVLRDLRRRRRGEERLFAYWDPSARRWREIRAEDVNDYLREISGEEMTAKVFRTWHGTVKAAGELAEVGPKESDTARKKAVSHAMEEAAGLLGNTPAVARSSYVDPKVIEAYEEGRTVAEPTEEAVIDLLTD